VNAATALDPETGTPSYSLTLGRPGVSHALQTAERLGLDASVVADARARVEPERLQIAELLAQTEAAERSASEARDEAVGALTRLTAREAELATEIERVRESAARASAETVAAAERELAETRAELAAARSEVRAALRARSESGADRRLGAAVERAASAERSLRRLDEPLPVLAPLAVGDPVEAQEIGLRGTIAALDGDEAEVVGVTGQRVRISVARLRPSRVAEPEAPAVRVNALSRGDMSDQLDVRGRRAQEAREAVRVFVDEAALAGLREVRVVHGRGTGAVRTAIRDELQRHPLVARQESEAQDGATVAYLTS
jgi:DNA mismatch repair protein MutS2